MAPIYRSNSFQVTVPSAGGLIDMSVIPLDRRTVWNPGIYGGIPPDDANASTFPNGVGPATKYGSTLTPSGGDDTSTIQSALNAAGSAASKLSRRYVLLGSGTFQVTSLSIPSYVILRGTLGANNSRLSTLDQPSNFGSSVVDMTGSGTGWGTIYTVSGTLKHGDSTITLNSTSGLSVGDIIALDHLSDGDQNGTWISYSQNPAASGIYVGDTSGMTRDWDDAPTATGTVVLWDSSLWYQRQSYSTGAGTENIFPDSTGYRHISEYHEILAIDGNTITVYQPFTNYAQSSNADVCGHPIHNWYYNTPQVYKSAGNGAMLMYAGLEDLAIHPSASPGQGSTPIYMQQAAFCWVKNVESNGNATDTGNTWNGRHLKVHSQVYRCEITGCYLHHSSNYNQGGNAYGLNFQGSECYIHNNVFVALNKTINFECTNGGNVFAYNYIDDASIGTGGSWQEAGFGTHGSFCHFELIEGNYTPNVTIDSEHGNNAMMMVFRNHCFGQNTWNYLPAAWGGDAAPARAIMIEGFNWEVTSIGNVLWTSTNKADYIEGFSPDWSWDGTGTTIGYVFERSVYAAGLNAPPSGTDYRDDGFSGANLHYHMDYHYSTTGDELYENPSNAVTTLPDSLHRTSAPDYFSGYTWPSVDPTATGFANQVKTLPAKARLDAGEA